MAGMTTFGSVAHAAASATRSDKVLGGGLLAGWAACGANAFGLLGGPLPLAQLMTSLALLIAATSGFALVQSRGRALYRAFHEGVVAGERKEQQRRVELKDEIGSGIG